MHWRKLVVSGAHQRGSNEPDLNFPSLCPAAEADQKPAEKKKTNKRVKWVDHFGGEITATKIFTADGDDVGVDGSEQHVRASNCWYYYYYLFCPPTMYRKCSSPT